MNEITIWESYNKKTGQWEHNHIEDGHCFYDKPIPKSKLQKKSWPNKQWNKSFGYLINNKVYELKYGE